MAEQYAKKAQNPYMFFMIDNRSKIAEKYNLKGVGPVGNGFQKFV